MFNGSENFNDDYFQVLERAGATNLNGTTNPDRTNYFQNVPVSALDQVLWMESDRMGHFLGAVDQAKLDDQVNFASHGVVLLRDVVDDDRRRISRIHAIGSACLTAVVEGGDVIGCDPLELERSPSRHNESRRA
jgi:hypothetical protein